MVDPCLSPVFLILKKKLLKMRKLVYLYSCCHVADCILGIFLLWLVIVSYQGQSYSLAFFVTDLHLRCLITGMSFNSKQK